jgi:hypothetical protein
MGFKAQHGTNPSQKETSNPRSQKKKKNRFLNRPLRSVQLSVALSDVAVSKVRRLKTFAAPDSWISLINHLMACALLPISK